MKLSISNIGWSSEQDKEVYQLMKSNDFSGLEIAPTRIFSEFPYDRKEDAIAWSKSLFSNYGLSVSSMQSIWYGRQEKIFGTKEERKLLLNYTKRAIDFAAAIGCRNLVFGCPKNRIILQGLPKDWIKEISISFFKELGDYAHNNGTVVAMEANPPIYNTNFINDTISALELIEQVDSKGFLLNLDIGTMIENGEKIDILTGQIAKINHVHISEPGLTVIRERQMHKDLISLLKKEGYNKFISFEMGRQESTASIKNLIKYGRSLVNLK